MYPSQLHGSAQHRQQENDRQWQHFLEYTRQQRLAQQPSGPVPDLTPTQQADLREYFNRQQAELDLARQQCGETRHHVARHSAASAKLEKQLDNTCNLNQASPLASVYTHTDTRTSTRTDKHTHKGNLEVAVTKGTTNLTVTHTHTHTHTAQEEGLSEDEAELHSDVAAPGTVDNGDPQAVAEQVTTIDIYPVPSTPLPVTRPHAHPPTHSQTHTHTPAHRYPHRIINNNLQVKIGSLPLGNAFRTVPRVRTRLKNGRHLKVLW